MRKKGNAVTSIEQEIIYKCEKRKCGHKYRAEIIYKCEKRKCGHKYSAGIICKWEKLQMQSPGQL